MAGLMSGYGLCQEKMVYIHIREAPLLRSALLFRAGPQLGRLSRFFLLFKLCYFKMIFGSMAGRGFIELFPNTRQSVNKILAGTLPGRGKRPWDQRKPAGIILEYFFFSCYLC